MLLLNLIALCLFICFLGYILSIAKSPQTTQGPQSDFSTTLPFYWHLD